MRRTEVYPVSDRRHTVATLLLEQGESLAFVQKQLGHSSIQVTVDTYGHLLPATNQTAIDGLDDAPACTPGAPGQSNTIAVTSYSIKVNNSRLNPELLTLLQLLKDPLLV